ncbi:MAG: chitobiase/beta-hexosaminidase C-terminal domain-containing protein [Clostridiales bacterium]|jgi:hypothetical protein|nr:chitobiase/beta-hexosaminidase C-terminal domain-containing protein [Clostridiales bacterium]
MFKKFCAAILMAAMVLSTASVSALSTSSIVYAADVTIVHAGTNDYLVANGTNLAYSTNATTLWRLTNISDGVFTIAAQDNPSYVLRVSDTSSVILDTYVQGDESQYWSVSLASSGIATIRTNRSRNNLYLGMTITNGALDLVSSSTNSKWRFAQVNRVARPPVASPESGNIIRGTTVQLTAPDGSSNFDIYYTTDVRAAKADFVAYTRAISFGQNATNVTLRAFVQSNTAGYADSDIVTFTYRITAPSPTPTPKPTQAAQPVASHSSGVIAAGTSVTLTCSTAGNTIYYTDDGSDPTDSATRKRYTQPVVISKTVTIKAIATAPGYANSDLSTFNYETYSSGTPSNPPGVTMTIVLKIGETRYTKNDVAAQFDVAPYVEPSSGRTMVPIRFIAEAFGAQVEWYNDIQTDIITLGNRSLSIVLGRELPNSMGKSMLIQDRLFVPVRYVSEQLGATVLWTAHTDPIIITM